MSFALSACATINISEDRIIQPDERPPAVAKLGKDYKLEHVEVTHADGATSRGIYLSSPQSLVTVLYFGGSQFRIDRESRPVIEALAKTSVDIVMFDYRGYGRSDGEPTTELLKSDAVDVLRFAKAKAKNKVVLYGLSLGSFVAASVAERQSIDGLILEAVATNVKDLASNLVPWYAKPFVTVRVQPKLLDVDNVRALKAYTGPLLVLAGEDDDLVPVRMQKSLWESVPTAKKVMHIFPNQDHKGLIESKEFAEILKQFLRNQVGA